jgi:CelD/BcsL family acetyltransferase involved in cellulose biosynthesis
MKDWSAMNIASTAIQASADTGTTTPGHVAGALPIINMRVEIVSNWHDLVSLRPQWDAVYAADSEAQFFLSWPWMVGRLHDLGTSWFVLVARAEADPSACTAFLPMRIKKTRKGDEVLHEMRMAGNPVADYAGFICRPEQERVVLAAFANALQKLMQKFKCSQLSLLNLRASERRLQFFMSPFARAKFSVERVSSINRDGIDNNICPDVTLPGDWDAYLKERLSSNMRQKLRRLLRHVETNPEYQIAQSIPSTVESDAQNLLNLWGMQWGDRKVGVLDKIKDQLTKDLLRLSKQGNIFMPKFLNGAEIVGILAIILDHQKKSCLFSIGGRNPNFAGPSPGLCLHAFAIRCAIENGFRTYDFLKGDEAYKFSFGAQKRFTNSFVVKEPIPHAALHSVGAK